MTQRAALILAMSFATSVSTQACYSGLRSTLTPKVPPAACYQLEYDTWIPTYLARAGTSMVGQPLPDTLALLATVAKTSLGHALFAVATVPSDSAHDTGFWIPRGQDSVDVRLPSRLGGRLEILLPATGVHRDGQAWTYLDQYSEMPRPIAMTTVTADSVSCPMGPS